MQKPLENRSLHSTTQVGIILELIDFLLVVISIDEPLKNFSKESCSLKGKFIKTLTCTIMQSKRMSALYKRPVVAR